MTIQFYDDNITYSDVIFTWGENGQVNIGLKKAQGYTFADAYGVLKTTYAKRLINEKDVYTIEDVADSTIKEITND